MCSPFARRRLPAMIGLILLGGFALPVCATAKGPVKVFILSGQSNMQGKASASTIEAAINDPKTRDEFKHLKPEGQWAVRNDVWCTFLDKGSRPGSKTPTHGPLTIGYGSDKNARDDNGKRITVPGVGPELGIGYVLGDHFDEQVLLIKACWGGRAVKYSFRPPSAMPTDEQIKAEVAAIKERKPDAEVTFESHKAGYGSDYRKVLSETKKVLDNIQKYFPDYEASQGYEIAGFIWFQGWNDAIGSGNPAYVEQMTHFIRDMRKDLNVPNLPFVIGELGTDGTGIDDESWVARFRKQQREIAALEEFKGTVALAETAQHWPVLGKDIPDMQAKWDAFRAEAKKNAAKPNDDPTRMDPGKYFQKNWVRKYKDKLAYTSDKRYHYLGSGACYYRMGRSMGKAMLELLTK